MTSEKLQSLSIARGRVELNKPLDVTFVGGFIQLAKCCIGRNKQNLFVWKQHAGWKNRMCLFESMSELKVTELKVIDISLKSLLQV